jgi:hypothetical protein
MQFGAYETLQEFGLVIAQILCRILGHRRSGRHIHVEKGSWRSRCKRCGIELVRVAPSDWQEPKEAA